MLTFTNQVPATWFAATAGIRRLASPVRRPLPPGAVAAFSARVHGVRTGALLIGRSVAGDLAGPLQRALGGAQRPFGLVDRGDQVLALGAEMGAGKGGDAPLVAGDRLGGCAQLGGGRGDGAATHEPTFAPRQ